MMRRMASEAVYNYFADPGKMVTTATVLQCRPVGRSENPLGTFSNLFEEQGFPSIPVKICGRAGNPVPLCSDGLVSSNRGRREQAETWHVEYKMAFFPSRKTTHA